MSPVRRQYLELKRQYPDAILFFRLGDFFETFDTDAEFIARELEITLTSRGLGQGERVPMAGVPCAAVDGYAARLIEAGQRIAICEQLSEPDGRGPVQRGVVRVLSPGTVVEDGLISPRQSTFLAALLVYRWVEAPMTKSLRRRVASWRDLRAPRAPSTSISR